jgi:SAM-dependent methyltransferase
MTKVLAAENQPQHLKEIMRNVAAWRRKPMLQRSYYDMFARFLPHLAAGVAGLNVECGAGIGALARVIPGCLLTDLYHTPWCDRIENVYQFSFATASIDNLVLFDVFHHLQYPNAFFSEAQRVLRPGGRILMIEPAMGALPRLIYQSFHSEPLAGKAKIDWSIPAADKLAQPDYYAAQANAWRVFWEKNHVFANDHSWKWIKIDAFACFSYFATGGFSGPQLLPTCAYRLLRKLDQYADQIPALFAGRLLIVLERKTSCV